MMTRALALVMLLTAGVLSATQAAPIVGADISHLPQLEAAGAKFYDQDATAAASRLRQATGRVCLPGSAHQSL